MIKKFLYLLLLLSVCAFAHAEPYWYNCKSLTGGSKLNSDLDAINGQNLNDGDTAVCAIGSYVYYYNLDDDSGLAESSPDVISPDANAGDKRWILVTITLASKTTTSPIINTILTASGKTGAVFVEDSETIFYHNENVAIKTTAVGVRLGYSTSTIQAANGETGLRIVENSTTDLYHDNSKKLSTASAGVDVTGIITATNIDSTIAYPDEYVTNTTPGTTDMTSAITSAISAGKYRIAFRDTTYLIDTVPISTAINLELILGPNTKLLHKASASDSMFVFSDSGATLKISGGTIDGNRDNNASEAYAHHLIDAPISRIEIHDVYFTEMNRGGLRFATTDTEYVLVEGSTFHECNFVDDFTDSDDPCTFISGYKGGRIKILNNDFIQTTDHGSDVTMHPAGIELSGAGPGEVWIEDNYFENLGNSQGGSPTQVVKLYTYTKYASIARNRFYDSSTASIVTNCADSLHIVDNEIRQLRSLSGQSTPVTIYADNNDRTYGNDDGQNLGGWEIRGNDIQIDGATNYSGGIYAIGSVASGEEVRNVTISQNTIRTAATTGNAIGIYATVEIEDINILNNKVAGLFGHGIKLAGDVNSEVDGNYLNPIAIIGNHISGSTYGILTDTDDNDLNFTISNNTTYNIVTQAIDIEQCQGIQGSGNSWQLTPEIHVDNYTIALEDFGKTFVNTGDSDGMVYQMPAYGTAPMGFWYSVTSTAAQVIDNNPDDADQIFPCTNAAGDKCRLGGTIGTSATFKLVSSDGWSVMSSEGTLSDQN